MCVIYILHILVRMTKNKKNTNANIHINNKLPFVSVCTPTFNRRPFIETMIKCFDSQDYPKNKMEWIIIDDGTDPIEDLVKSHPSVKYFKYDEKMTLGKKRNIMHKKSCGDIIVYMDDDDFYPPERVSHAVERLTENPNVLCAGSSEMYIYFKDNKYSKGNNMVQFGPYGANHATAGTFAFKRKLLKDTKYNEDACLAEEKEFLKDYSVPFVQLDPLKTILVFSHSHNTFDKRTLLENITGNPYIKYSPKRVEDFIKDKEIIKFFLEDMENKLSVYEPGNINMKPDVLKQIKELEIRRREMEKTVEEDRKKHMEYLKTNSPQNGITGIVLQEDGRAPRELNSIEVVELMTAQQKQLSQMGQLKELYSNSLRENARLKEIIQTQQGILDEKNVYISDLETKIAMTNDVIVVDIEK
jgi:glycosyltransferase involved in cell wall biosynthesis